MCARRSMPKAAFLAPLLLLAAFAGCMDDNRDADDRNGNGNGNGGTDMTDAPSAHSVTILLTGMDAPDAGDQYAVILTIGHIALHDADTREWVPILTDPIDATLFFNDTEPTVLDTYPLLARTYDRLELLIDNASVLSPTGTEPATIDRPVCYTAITLDLTASAPPTQLEALVSGQAAIRGSPGAWTVQPALVGSLTDHPDHEPVVQDVDCANV